MSTISAVADDAAIGYELDIHEQSESFGLIRKRLAVKKILPQVGGRRLHASPIPVVATIAQERGPHCNLRHAEGLRRL